MSHVLRVGPRTILLDRPSFVIGSGPECDCRIVAPGVAENHVCLLQNEHGIRVTPLEGRTRVNDTEISRATIVTHGMTIKLADVSVQLIDTEAIERERLVTQKLRTSDLVGVLADALDAIDTAIENARWEEAGARVRIAGDNVGDDPASRRFLDPLGERAMRIAREHTDPRWIDWILALSRRHRHVPASEVVDAMVELSRTTSWRPQQIVEYAKSVVDSDSEARIRLRRLLALG